MEAMPHNPFPCAMFPIFAQHNFPPEAAIMSLQYIACVVCHLALGKLAQRAAAVRLEWNRINLPPLFCFCFAESLFKNRCHYYPQIPVGEHGRVHFHELAT